MCAKHRLSACRTRTCCSRQCLVMCPRGPIGSISLDGWWGGTRFLPAAGHTICFSCLCLCLVPWGLLPLLVFALLPNICLGSSVIHTLAAHRRVGNTVIGVGGECPNASLKRQICFAKSARLMNQQRLLGDSFKLSPMTWRHAPYQHSTAQHSSALSSRGSVHTSYSRAAVRIRATLVINQSINQSLSTLFLSFWSGCRLW